MEKSIKIGNTTYSVASDDEYLEAMGENFEPHMVQLFCALISPDDIVADIGANIGLTAILFSTLARKVIAFEPSPSTYNILSGNIARTGIGNIEQVNLGLGQMSEHLSITFAKNNRSGGYISDKIRPKTGHVTEEIRIDTLDHYFSDSSVAPTFLKIDVEGFEQSVIKGGEKLLKNNKPIVVMEMNHFCLDVLQRITIPDFLDFLRSVFPHLYAVDTDNATIVNLHDADQAYFVMHEHVVNHRFPNLVGGFDASLKRKLDSLKRIDPQTVSDLPGPSEESDPEVLDARGSITIISAPKIIRKNEIFFMKIQVSNESDAVWSWRGTKPVRLSYHWQDRSGNQLVFDGERTEIETGHISPGVPLICTLRVMAPKTSGDIELVVTLVQEGVCWFEARGFKPYQHMVSIS